MEEKKTVAEMLREKPNGSSLECYAATTMMGILCRGMESCPACYNKTAEMLADAIEAERTKTEHGGVDVDALLKLADDLEETNRRTGRVHLQPIEAADRIREILKGATGSKPTPLPEGIEWPRFEDGELVRFGDKTDKGTVYSVDFSKNIYTLYQSDSFQAGRGTYGTPVKRPEIKVLDADGVPIKVGDTVYHEVDGSELTVVRFRDEKEDGEVMVDVEGEWICVRQYSLTHRKPDTQEDIDADMALGSYDYLKKHGLILVKAEGETKKEFKQRVRIAHRQHILERQRRVMGGEYQ